MTNDDKRYQWYIAMIDALRSRQYSASTRKRYLAIYRCILQAFPDKDIKSLDKRDFESFFADMERAGASASTINQAISAATFLWRNVFELPFPIKVRPIADKHLPTVISRYQVMRLIAAAKTSKTRLALALAYSAGLRVSEIATLELKDINRERGVIYIRAGKGRKDRVVPLSELVADMLDQYLTKYPTKRWMFKNSSGSHVNVRCLQRAIAIARGRAGLSPDVTMHTLRHSFATHLVERGENLVTIKELMGHSSLSTLQQYVHLADTGILSTKSPLDNPPLY
jgi:integrase/recombinase XerD